MDLTYRKKPIAEAVAFDDTLLPSDKSISHRVLLLAALESGNTVLENVNMGGAIIPLLEAFEVLGIPVTQPSEGTLVVGTFDVDAFNRAALSKTEVPTLNLGSSSTAARLLIGVLAGLGVNAIVDGDESLRPRPVDWVVDPLRELGAEIVYLRAEGELPIQIKRSEIHGGTVTLSVGSAQALSAILFAGYAANIEISVHQRVRSRDHTQRIMQHLGASISIEGDFVHFKPGSYKSFTQYRVPLDPSAVVYPIVSYFLQQGRGPSKKDLHIRNVCLNETRTGFLFLLKRLGASIQIQNTQTYFEEEIGDIFVPAEATLEAVNPWLLDDDFIFHAMIDEIPLAVAVASQMNGRSVFKGLGELTFKETNRILSTQSLLKDFGIEVEVFDDVITVEGKQPLRPGGRVNSFGDHRLAMTAAAICSGANIDAYIERGSCYQTSYPDFVESINQISQGTLTEGVFDEAAYG